MLLQALTAVKPRQIPVERPERQVSCLVRDLENQAAGKTYLRTLSELLERAEHDVGVLQSQVLVIEQHLRSNRDLRRSFIPRIERPNGLR